jgi:predicted Ser/Thr protein kinase
VSRGFKSPHHYSSSVYLLDNYVVRKNLKNNAMGNFLFQNEILALKKLQPYKYFPKLLGYDNLRLSIFMTFCGEQISSKNLPDDWERQIDEIETILTKINVNSNDMILRNVCVLNKRIYIIDFGLYSQFSVSIKETISKLKYDLRKISVNKNLLYNI